MENAYTEKIEVHSETKRYGRRLQSLKEDKSINLENKKVMLNFLKDCELGKISRKPCGSARLMKYIYLLTRVNQMFENKPFKKLTAKDIERVITNLRKGEYKRQLVHLVKIGKNRKKLVKIETDKPLDMETVSDFEMIIKRLSAYIFEKGDKYQKLAGWIKPRHTIKEIPALSREEVERLAESFNLKYKAAVMVLFDSGARASEFLNVRIGDLTKREGYYIIRIKHSKTKPRTISVPMCTEVLDAWLSAHPDKDNPQAQLFPITYDALRIRIKEQSQKILQKNVNIHLFRHSSATYYCHRLNQYQLCYRYGWSMTSEQPQRYIDREGINEQETAQIIKSDEISSVKKENQELREDLIRLRTSYREIENALHKVNDFMGVFAKNKEFKKLIAKEGRVGKLMQM